MNEPAKGMSSNSSGSVCLISERGPSTNFGLLLVSSISFYSDLSSSSGTSRLTAMTSFEAKYSSNIGMFRS